MGVMLVVGCATPAEDPPPPCATPEFAAQVDVLSPHAIGIQGVVVHWVDQPADEGVEGPPAFGVTSLRREFATRTAAESFRGPFVVLVGGVERARAEVDFGACDFVAELGEDPSEVTQAVFRFTFELDGSFGPGSHIVWTPQLACFATATPPDVGAALVTPCAADERRLVYYLALDPPRVPTRILLDGEPIAPRSIGTWGDWVYLEIVIESPASRPPTDVDHQLSVELDGVVAEPITASFDECTRLYGDALTLMYQRQSLSLEGGVLQAVPGCECGFSDGRRLNHSP